MRGFGIPTAGTLVTMRPEDNVPGIQPHAPQLIPARQMVNVVSSRAHSVAKGPLLALAHA